MRSHLKCKACGGYAFHVIQNRNYGDPGGPQYEYRYEFRCISCDRKVTTGHMDEIEIKAKWEEIDDNISK